MKTINEIIAEEALNNIDNMKPIPNYSKYLISKDGYIVSLDYNHTGLNVKLKTFINAYGYVAVNLMENGKRKRYLLHRLLGIVFIDNPNNLATINHKNGIKTDNRIENLEWLSVADNLKHAHFNKMIKYSSGENHYLNKYTNKQIQEIREHLNNGLKAKQIEDITGINLKYISYIKCKPKFRVNV